MIKKIIVVEDKLEELQKACDLVMAKGFMPLACSTNEDAVDTIRKYADKGLVGILTDLHFPVKEGGSPEGASGLHIVYKALMAGIPVVICSDIDHHYASWATDLVGAIEKATGKKVAGFVQDSKNWERALGLLLNETRED
ncbi:MAG: hypothetical protein ACD_50C00184G0003 [uncultured bacterium]|nr:MAG: hypothetical protein ACD_50C00184G0003 [uncultured bacterium]